MTLSTLSQYGTHFQIKVISSLLTHKEFLVNIHDIISDEYFDNTAHKWIIKEILNYYEKYHATPSMDILKVELKKLNNDVLQLSIKEQLREAYTASDEDLVYIEEEFSNFCKNQQLKKALLNSVELLNAGDYDSIRYLVDNALKAGQDKNLGLEYNKDTETRYREEQRIVIPTPWALFNEIMQGGLGNGDFGLIFGNPGGGKSWTLISLGGYAVKMGFNVLHYTLELGEDYVGRRYDAFFTNVPVNVITQHKHKVDDIIPQLPGNLVIKEYSPGKASISTLESHIQKCVDQGFKPDLIIIDYVDLLRSKRNSRERKEEIDDIYVSTKGLARELKIPIWSVSQVNRA
jgi:replicative DNA helicase